MSAHERLISDLAARVKALEQTVVRYRAGEISDTGPLDVKLGGSDIPYEDVRTVSPLVTTGDTVGVLAFGNDLLVLGAITGTVATYGTAITAGSGWTSSATFSKIGRLVVLQGSFSKTSGTPAMGDVMGTLPSGARPGVRLNPPVVTQNNNVNGSIFVQTDGGIVWRTGSTTETDSTSIDGIAFVVA